MKYHNVLISDPFVETNINCCVYLNLVSPSSCFFFFSTNIFLIVSNIRNYTGAMESVSLTVNVFQRGKHAALQCHNGFYQPDL